MEVQLNQSFWQVNFWGILGTVTGVSGVLISWLGFKYNKPKIKIERITLVIPDWISTDWAGKTIKDLESKVLSFELEIQVSNRKGGAGSIDKPTLLIVVPRKKRSWFSRSEVLKIYPRTQHEEYERESGNITTYRTVRHGKSFNLGSGEKADEKLKYISYNAKIIQKYANNLSRASYYIEYVDNKGKRHKEKIRKILKETEIEN